VATGFEPSMGSRVLYHRAANLVSGFLGLSFGFDFLGGKGLGSNPGSLDYFHLFSLSLLLSYSGSEKFWFHLLLHFGFKLN
jgi:hypothetical protein